MEFLVLPSSPNYAPPSCTPLENFRICVSLPARETGLYTVEFENIHMGLIITACEGATAEQAETVATALWHALAYAD